MDLGEILDTTVAVEVEFMGKPITARVYASGNQRLRIEEREVARSTYAEIAPVFDRLKDLQAILATAGDGEEATPEMQVAAKDAERVMVIGARRIVPMMVAGLEDGGEPITYKGELFPITEENLAKLPDAFVNDLYEKAQMVWNDPTLAEPLPDVSAQTESLTEDLADQTAIQ